MLRCDGPLAMALARAMASKIFRIVAFNTTQFAYIMFLHQPAARCLERLAVPARERRAPPHFSSYRVQRYLVRLS